MTEETHNPTPEQPRRRWPVSGYELALIVLLLAGAYLRTVGLAWDADQHLHPDERFLTGVLTAIQPVESFSDYWDTANSPLNPHNRGHGFFVYGTLPLFVTRYIGEWMGQTGFGEITLVGRQLSAMADLAVVVLVYLLAAHLYGKRAGLLAAAFSTFTVLQIQLSHYFAVDTFVNLFTLLAIYFAARISIAGDDERPFPLINFLLFGAALGMAVASKVSTAPVAVLLPLAVAVRLSKTDRRARYDLAWDAFGYMVAAAVVSLLVFRIFQPYAFSGPGFFGFKPNELWVGNLQSLQAQQAGDIDWPPSIQWARRPVWFSFQNMVIWGLGLPLGLTAWLGFAVVTIRLFKGEWQRHAVIWFWTAFFFAWQSSVFNPTMRYELPIYPLLAVFAGWLVIRLWDAAAGMAWRRWLRPLAAVAGGAVLAATILWAFAFVQIYTRPVTRIAASEWIYENIPGPINLRVENGGENYNQLIPFPYYLSIRPELPYSTSFRATTSGDLSQVWLNEVIHAEDHRAVVVRIYDAAAPDVPLVEKGSEVIFSREQEFAFTELQIDFDAPVALQAGNEYIVQIEVGIGVGELSLSNVDLLAQLPDGSLAGLPVNQDVVPISPEMHFHTMLPVTETQTATSLRLYLSLERPLPPSMQVLRLTFSDTPDYSQIMATATAAVDLSAGAAEHVVFDFDHPVTLTADQIYYMQLHMDSEGGAVVLNGSAIAHETAWDEGLPLRSAYYDGYGGIYQRDLNLDMYADDTPDKLARFLSILDQSEYVVISSSRQWASTTRIPERYPMLVTYYRNLLGCPDSMQIETCYNQAQVGDFQGALGFALVQVFQSNPTLGTWQINDQPSEEAFTVYDHPKVFIFKKTADYDPARAAAILGAVDFNAVIRLTPKQATQHESTDLLLPPVQLARQRAGGTWAELFDVDALVNRSEFAAVVVWYLVVLLLGLAVYPLVRLAFSGLPDKGYPLARIAGLLLLAYLSWLFGSVGLSYSRGLIAGLFGLLLLAGGLAGYKQREELKAEFKERGKYFLGVEAAFLAFFVLFLLVRLGNPDLWHPWKGGEKPMDFSYFNAVLKSTSFPPFDPWFAGGYINYYYYGFVYVGTLVKLLGIVPSLAYNLILPTLYAMVSLGAFSVGWNIVSAIPAESKARVSAWWAGVAAALGVATLGNLGTIRMLLRGYQRLAAGGEYSLEADLISKIGWTLRGLVQSLGGEALPYYRSDWYWIPSRAIRAPEDVEPITEFPWFTFIYADLHAHMIALPITLLALSWALSVVLGRFWQDHKRGEALWSIAFGALAIGALRPTNTWDFPTYLALGVVALFYTAARHYRPSVTDKFLAAVQQYGAAFGTAGLLGLLSFVLYQPFAEWYRQGYTEVMLWPGTQTPTTDYLVHWGVFLFLLIFWMAWETRQWMAATPLSSLRKLQPHLGWIAGAVLATLLAMVWLHLQEVRIYWLALPLAIWAAVLLLRPDMPDNKRFVLFLVGTGLFLTLMVEVIVLSGDIGRMNTVFKFYLQVWVLFGVSSAAGMYWVLMAQDLWRFNWRMVWAIGMVVLVGMAAMYPIFATFHKVVDRMALDAPHTLDGMDYMPYAEYGDMGKIYDLSEDHAAIQWLQQNVSGSPVIVEGHNTEYRWGNRITMYTGLPGVLGWRWHQTQQRVGAPYHWIIEREEAINQFYVTGEIDVAKAFLAEFDVSYIIVGQLEHAYYNSPGLGKFEDYDGLLWQEVFRQGETVIYQVLPDALGE